MKSIWNGTGKHFLPTTMLFLDFSFFSYISAGNLLKTKSKLNLLFFLFCEELGK